MTGMTMQLQFTEHKVMRKAGLLRFTGALLAHVSSRRRYAPRWADLSLYRLGTVDGRRSDDPAFVLVRTGHSRIYHQDVCPEVRHHLPFGHELTEPAPPVDELVPCPVCAPLRPTAFDQLDFASTHRFEVTKHNASVCRDTADLVARLSPPSSPAAPSEVRRASSLPWLSMNLLTAAADLDDLVAELCTEEVSVS